MGIWLPFNKKNGIQDSEFHYGDVSISLLYLVASVICYKFRIDMCAYLSNPDYLTILFLSEGILGRKSLSSGGYNGGLMSSFSF